MKAFLTQAWLEDVVRVMSSADSVRALLPEADFVLEQIISGGPAGEARYWIALKDPSVTGGIGQSSSAPDVSMELDHETAACIARDELKPQAAFMQGKLKVTGNMGKLLRYQDAIAELGPCMASVPTEF